mmetsp:Transcript_23519/g.36955  ORF Transcript_23519/g.36955 Transcript_23519/m.36955 type:complete len:100 (-) Transcript_23519:490-789(-)
MEWSFRAWTALWARLKGSLFMGRMRVEDKRSLLYSLEATCCLPSNSDGWGAVEYQDGRAKHRALESEKRREKESEKEKERKSSWEQNRASENMRDLQKT